MSAEKKDMRMCIILMCLSAHAELPAARLVKHAAGGCCTMVGQGTFLSVSWTGATPR